MYIKLSNLSSKLGATAEGSQSGQAVKGGWKRGCEVPVSAS